MKVLLIVFALCVLFAAESHAADTPKQSEAQQLAAVLLDLQKGVASLQARTQALEQKSAAQPSSGGVDTSLRNDLDALSRRLAALENSAPIEAQNRTAVFEDVRKNMETLSDRITTLNERMRSLESGGVQKMPPAGELTRQGAAYMTLVVPGGGPSITFFDDETD